MSTHAWHVIAWALSGVDGLSLALVAVHRRPRPFFLYFAAAPFRLPFRLAQRTTHRRSTWTALVGLACAVSLGGLVWAFVAVPGALVGRPSQVTPDARLQAVDDNRAVIVQAIGGAAILGGLIFTASTFALSRSSQVSDRYTKAIGQLESTQTAVRLGGIFALRVIAAKSQSYRASVMTVLTAYVRELSSDDAPLPSPDIQAAMQVLGDPQAHEGLKFRLDLRGAKLSHLLLAGATIDHHFDLSGAVLRNAVLTDCHMEGLLLLGADLTMADFAGSHLDRATIDDALVRGLNVYMCSTVGLSAKGCELASMRNLTHTQRATIST
jgi:hypothetical protein